jgi:zinc/manganese transport system substrate-binding protein
MKYKRLNLVIGSIIGLFIIAVLTMVILSNGNTTETNGKIRIVAAENFWGSLAGQLGGNKTQVFSIVSDPNADPHEYESNAKDARSIAEANYVILNGDGYDTWANKLLDANPNPLRKTLTVSALVGQKQGDNPHLWYNPNYVNRAVKKMETDLIALNPKNKSYYQDRYKNLMTQLSTYQNRIKSIAKQYAGTKVSATEDIFVYLAKAADLNLISPASFTEAVAEGNDPPASSVVEFQQQLASGQSKALVYNEQTVTPLTDSIKQLAARDHIPLVGVTETIQPPNTNFQVWMNSELINLQDALSASRLINNNVTK